MTEQPDPFERLAPLVRHHIINDLNWTSLRPVQEMTIEPVLMGENVIVVAPTAGGKTEAAVFPVLSRVSEERWRGLSVLYLSPIRALLNTQQARLARYFGWLGATVGLWHGDTGQAARRRIRRTPPTCLMTTPESIESMLCSSLTDARVMFGDVRLVIVDEVHGFADGDRGWHLLAVLERLSTLAGRDLQRVGLSATVGNLDTLLGWMAGHSKRPRRAIRPAWGAGLTPEVMIDLVGSDINAARVIAALHRGEKRLVFCDSRLQAERIGDALRRLEITTYVTHSSLSADERRRAEGAFIADRDCVIVATSTLELGIDVGDLDRVIQIDAPALVASFLQRMGRTGRRGGPPNCLFLATGDNGLLRAAGLVSLWAQGFVEDALCPPYPIHLVAQQAIAVLLEQRAMPVQTHRDGMRRTADLYGIDASDADTLRMHLIDDGWLFEDAGRVLVGPLAEERLGHRHFIELLSVFSTPPFFSVQHGRHAIGQVHDSTFFGRSRRDGPTVLVLGGRAWRVTHLDLRRRVAYVEPTDQHGRTRWIGSGVAVHQRLAGEMRRLLRGEGTIDRHLSKRARSALGDLVAEHTWLAADGTHLRTDVHGRATWWTFAGTRANAALARRLRRALRATVTADALEIDLRFDDPSAISQLEALRTVLERLGDSEEEDETEATDEVAEKFAECLPHVLRQRLGAVREVDREALLGVIHSEMRWAMEWSSRSKG